MATFWSSANVEPKRKFKFLVQFNPINPDLYDIPSFVVKKVDKPGFTVTETKHTFLGHNFFFPGKLEWKEISLSIIDPSGTGVNQVNNPLVEEVVGIPDMTKNLTNILSDFGYQSPAAVGRALNGGGDVQIATGGGSAGGTGIRSFSKAGSVSATGEINILQIDDDGNIVEKWTLKNAWIKEVNFGSNDYASDDAQEITIKIRFDWAEFYSGIEATNAAPYVTA
jgi:hypothetical protein